MTESLTEILKLRLSADPGVQLDLPQTVADKMVRVLLVKAMNGDVEAIREVWDRVESLPCSNSDCPSRSTLDESLEQKFEALRNAGSNAWDKIEDPEAYLKETTGS
jgi:hypothetical protein